jgi:hypothetical protein
MWLALVGLFAGCGGHSTPATPTATTTIVLNTESLTLYRCDANGDGCRYSFGLTNTGTACADNVRGTITQTLADGTTPARSSWSWNGMLPPNQVARVDDCCVGSTGILNVQPQWNSVICP